MPLKIQFPKANKQYKRRVIIAQGICMDATKVTATLTKAGAAVAGQPLAVLNPKSWRVRYANLTPGNYRLKVEQLNSPSVIASAEVDFTIDPPAPPPVGTPPTVLSPGAGEEVGIVFTPQGSTDPALSLTQCLFTDNAGNTYDAVANGTVIGPDSNGDWSATIDASAAQPNPISSGTSNCSLTVSNNAGNTGVNGLSVGS